MSYLQIYQVVPDIPESLSFLDVLSRNVWWCWRKDALELFHRIDPRLWKKAKRNPIEFLTHVSKKRWEELANDEGFLVHQQRVKEQFDNQVCTPIDRSESPFDDQEKIAYFSMEFGIHESIPLFSGGLGILAGDHLKASSDMGLPLVGVGLLYRQGYFRQFLDQEGWQQEEYPETDIYHLPVERALDRSGNEVYVRVTGPDIEINALVWRIEIGRVTLYLLDTNLPENSPEVRMITSRLYGGEEKMRLAQEALLGIGGIRALTALGIYPAVCHMNEGHSAFSSLERLALIKSRYNIDLKTALEIVPRTTIFTTHTPVAAGHDEFPSELVRPFLRPLEDQLGAKEDEILSWGQPTDSDHNGPLSMFILGVRMAQYCNGVSKLHGEVARRMWLHVWPDKPEDEIPIRYVTNGVHVASWISSENALLLESYLGPEWNQRSWDPNIVSNIDNIHDEDLWHSHEMCRSRLIRTCRELLVKQYGRRNAPRAMMQDLESVLEQNVLTIAFARRFAPYKRANLLLQDPERFEAIINSETNPVQFVFAGKAHPKNQEGKELIKQLIQFARKPSVRKRIIFIEDYDIDLTRLLVQGADVWLNTPRRPLEACGTSGMKAAINGVLNLSILDGWWCEGYSENRGWQIGNGEEYVDTVYQDATESQALYNILENDLIPCYYERKKGSIPTRWIKMMKESMKMAIQGFCSHRMVKEYQDQYYMPAINRLRELLDNDAAEAKKLSAQFERISSLWSSTGIERLIKEESGPFKVGESFRVKAIVHLGELGPDEVEVQLYYGHLKLVDTLTDSKIKQMTVQEEQGNGQYLYSCNVTCQESGRYGFTARIIPRGDEWIKSTPGLITWG